MLIQFLMEPLTDIAQGPNKSSDFMLAAASCFEIAILLNYSLILIKSSLPYFAKVRTLSERGRYQD